MKLSGFGHKKQTLLFSNKKIVYYKIKKEFQKGNAFRILLKIIQLDYFLRNFVLKLFSSIFFKAEIQKIKSGKILVRRSNGLGDSVCALAAIQAIKENFPVAQIDLLTSFNANKSPGLPELIQPGFFNEIIKYEKFSIKDLSKELKHKNYDLFIELSSNVSSLNFQLRTIILSKLAGIPYGIGWRISTTKFLKKQQEKFFDFLPENERLLEILKEEGLEVNQNAEIKNVLVSQSNAEKENVKLLFNDKLADKNKNISLMIGGGRKQNIWPSESFKTVAKYYINKGYNILFLGGSNENFTVQMLCDELGISAFNYCNLSDFSENIEILKNSCLAISNDTGLMHLSYSVGTPVIALFSNRDYSGKWFPPDDGKNIVLRAENISCSLCFSDTCSNNICMQVISPEIVIEKADQLLKKLS